VACHPEGSGRGTATLKFYEGRDNLPLDSPSSAVTVTLTEGYGAEGFDPWK
jgi:hypothetical protein